MKPELFLGLALFASTVTPALAEAPVEDCVELVEYSVGEPDVGYGIVEIEWEARIRNRCDTSYYATLTLVFLDASGESLHESQTRSVIEPGPPVTISKLAMLNEDQGEHFTDTHLTISGQALP